MLNCIFDILKEKSDIESIKTFEYFLNTLKNTIDNVDCVNTDDEDFEEKDVVEVHKEIILKKLKSSIVDQHDGFVMPSMMSLAKRRNKQRRSAVFRSSHSKKN